MDTAPTCSLALPPCVFLAPSLLPLTPFSSRPLCSLWAQAGVSGLWLGLERVGGCGLSLSPQLLTLASPNHCGAAKGPEPQRLTSPATGQV